MATPHAIRLAEIVAALSIATDLGMGQPVEFALQGCILSVRLADRLGLNDTELREVYYQALLRYIGCNVETQTLATLIGDEHAIRRDFAVIDNGHTPSVARLVLRYIGQVHANDTPLDRIRALAHGLLTFPNTIKDMFSSHCEVAQRLGERLGLSGNLIRALGQLYERWDGKGLPNGLKGEAITPAVRVVALAQDAVIFHRLGGLDAAVAVVRERRGGAYDPHMADTFVQHATQLCADFTEQPTWEQVIGLEPGRRIMLSETEFESACRAMADFVDIKSPYTLNHSSGVAQLAEAAARSCGLPEADAIDLRHAGYLHDLGRVAISAGVWCRAGALSAREWEQVRLHPYHTERILARPALFQRLGAIAGLHHERLDGSGYHRNLSAAMLIPQARILAAADVYHALNEPRPHRPAYAADAAAGILQQEARAGRLDPDAVAGVLQAAGQAPASRRRELVAGLSDREIEVLRLLARGQSIREVATTLVIAPKTVDNHIQHIYAKIGASTRAGATLFAMEHHLL